MNKHVLVLIIGLIFAISVPYVSAEYYFGEDDRGSYVEGHIQISAQMETALEQLPYTYAVEVIGEYLRVYYDPRFLGIELHVNRIIQVLERNVVDSYHIAGVIIPFCAWDYGRNEKVGFYFNNGVITQVRNHPLCT